MKNTPKCGCHTSEACSHCKVCQFAESEAHVHPKVPDLATKMLQEIIYQSNRMGNYAQLALLEPNEKKRDKCIERIIELNENIEELYSSNWH